VRLASLLCLAIAPCACCAGQPPDLQKEDLRAVQDALKKRDASLDWFSVVAKQVVDAAYSLMVVEAAPTELRPGIPQQRVPVYALRQIGIFVVSGVANQVRLVLDTYPLRSTGAYPTLEQPTTHVAYAHFYSDYGYYEGSIKYIYDLESPRPPLKIRYGILALTSSERRNGKLRYTASFGRNGEVYEGWTERHAMIVIEPRAGGAPPAYTITDAPAPPDYALEPAPLATADGQSVIVENKTPPGQPHQSSGIDVIGKSATKQYYPAPIPTMALYRKVFPDKQAPGEIEDDIGPFVLDRNKIWFASTFYDSEGVSGVGAIGSFDISTRKYDMRYLPEIAPWSGSAILLDGGNLWIGLMRRPEGAEYGAGLLRYNITSGAVAKYPVPDYIHTIDRLGDTVYCGTSHGLYTVRGNKVTQFRFEPDDKGKLIMVPREARQPSVPLR
jgi:hypothetical protein